MTITSRNVLLAVAAIAAGCALGATAVALFFSAPHPAVPVLDAATDTVDWLLWRWPTRDTMPIAALGVALGLGVVSFVGLLMFRRLFRRTSSAEIFFVAIFLATLSIEQFRVLQYLVLLYDLPIHFGALVSRAIRFGHLVGGFSLFTAGLYAAGVEYPRTGSVLLVLNLLSFAIVYFMPVDALELMPLLVHRVGTGQTLDILLVVLSFLTIANYVYSAARGLREDSAVIASCAVAVVIGRSMLLFPPNLAAAVAGGALLLAGLTVYAWANRAYYLWY